MSSAAIASTMAPALRLVATASASEALMPVTTIGSPVVPSGGAGSASCARAAPPLSANVETPSTHATDFLMAFSPLSDTAAGALSTPELAVGSSAA